MKNIRIVFHVRKIADKIRGLILTYTLAVFAQFTIVTFSASPKCGIANVKQTNATAKETLLNFPVVYRYSE